MANSKSWKIFRSKAIISTDVGQHQMWTAQFYPFSYPRQWITSGGLGTMGLDYQLLWVLRAIKGTDKVSINFYRRWFNFNEYSRA